MAGWKSFTIEQGADWSEPITWTDAAGTPVNFTGYTAVMPLVARDGTTARTLTTGSEITVSGTTLTLALDQTATAALAKGSYRYTLTVTSPGGVDTRLLEGYADVG